MDRLPLEADLYVPRKATSEVWVAFRLSYSDPKRVFCTVCHLWLTWKRTTSNLLLHCKSWHRADDAGRLIRRQKTPASSSNSIALTPSPSPSPSSTRPLVSSAAKIAPHPPPSITPLPAAAPTTFSNDYLAGLNLALESGASPPPPLPSLPLPTSGLGPGPEPSEDRVARAAAHMLVADVLPPTFLEGAGFLSFTRSLAPSYTPPSRRTLLSHLDTLFSTRAGLVAEALSHAPTLSLAVDIWSTPTSRTFATVTAHTPTSSPLALHIHHFSTPSSPEDTLASDAVTETLRAWKLDPSTILSITSPTDLSARHFPLVHTHVTCFARVVQRAMRGAIARHEDMLVRVIAAVSNTAAQTLPRCWLSVCQAMRICTKAEGAGFDAPMRDDIAAVVSLWSLLRPARKAVEKLAEGHDFLSLSIARAQLEDILDAATTVSIGREVHQTVRGTAFHVAQTISDALSTWKAEDRAESLVLSSVLDPAKRCVAARRGGPGGMDEAVELLKRHVVVDKAVDLEEGRGALEVQARAYLLAFPLSPLNESAQEWWKTNGHSYPALYQIAQKVLFIPATAASPREVFAVDSDLVRRRQRLTADLDVSPAYIQAIMFLNYNRTL